MADKKPWEMFAAPEEQGPWSQFAAAPEKKEKKSTIGSELVRGGKQLASSIQTGAEALFGTPEEAALAGLERGRRISEEAGEGVSLEAIKRAYEKEGLLSAAGEVAGQIPRALAGQGAQLAAMAAAAKAGAMAGTAVAPGVGTVIGGALGAGASLLPQFLGANVERQVQEQIEAGQAPKVDLGRAGAAAAGQAAIEGAGTAFVLGKRVVKGVLGIADDAALATNRARQEMVKAAERTMLQAAGRGAVRGGAEIPVEVAQQILERAQAGLDVTSPEALSEYGEAAYQAALVGGPLGAVSGPIDTGMARQARAQIQQAEAEQEKQRIAQEQKAELERIAAERAAEEERMRPIREAEARVPAEEPVGPSITRTDRAALLEGEDPLAAAIRARREAEEAKAEVPLGEDYEFLQREKQRLLAEPQTKENRAQLKRIEDQILGILQRNIEWRPGGPEAVRASVFGEAELPTPITREQLMAPKIEPFKPATTVPRSSLLGAAPAGGGVADLLTARREAEAAQAEVPLSEDYAFLTREKNRLSALPKTPENTAAIGRIDEEIRRLDVQAIERRRRDAEAAKTSVFAQEQLPPVESRGAVVAERDLAEMQAREPFPEPKKSEIRKQIEQAERLAGTPEPITDVEMDLKKEEESLRGLKAKNRGRPLIKAIAGLLDPKEIPNIGIDDKRLKGELMNKVGKGTFLSELVSNGSLDEFLEPSQRLDSPSRDVDKATQTIREKIEDGDYSFYGIGSEIKKAEAKIDYLARSIGEPKRAEFEISEVEPGEAASIERTAGDAEVLELMPEVEGLRYQRAETKGKGLGKDRVQSIVDAIKSLWKNAPEVVVAENMDDPAIPAEVRAHNKAAMQKGAKGSPRGFFYKGKAYVLADAATSPTQVMETLFHESLGHYGLRGTFGPEMESVLRDVVKNRRADVEAKAKQYGLDPKNESDMLEAAEEVLAEIAQTKPGLSFVKRAIAAIRNFLRKLGFPFEMSNDDIIQKYILPARAFVEKGGSKGVGGKPAAMRVAENKLPPVPAGMTRVYRGEYRGPKKEIPEWIKSIQKDSGQMDAQGRWWTESFEVAKWYAEDAGPEGGVVYQDIPSDVVEKSRVKGSSVEKFSRAPEEELFLPMEYVGRGKPAAMRGQKPSVAYHSGDLKFGRDTVLGRMMGGRSTGHFGTGVYFVGDKSKLKDTFGLREERPIQEIDFSKYNLFRPATDYVAQRLHDGLRKINSLIELDVGDQEDFKAAVKKAIADLDYATGKGEKPILAAIRKHLEQKRDLAEKNAFESTYIPTLATEVMKELGYEGIDVRGLYKYDNTEYGSVIYGREVSPDEKPAAMREGRVPQTETEAFKRWFGDSKVVDENGKPLVVYHGTASDFSAFAEEKLGINTRDEEGELGFFFTAKPFLSDSYAEIASKGGWSKKTEGGAPVVYPVYLSIKNPKTYETASSFYRDAEKFKGRLNEWRKELEDQGFDGVIVRSDFEEVIAFRPNQIKSATGNVGTYDPENADIRYQREAEPEERAKEPKRNILGKPVLGSWTSPTDTKLAGTKFNQDDLIYSLQDKQVDIKRVVQNITETAGRIAAKWNPYLQEELYHGRTARATKEFLQDELRPLIKEIQSNGMTIEEVEKYLHNRHAEDYNKHVAKVNPRNPKMQDGGSGIKTEDARKYLADLPDDKRKVYEDIAKKVDAITKKTRNLVIESGLEGPDTIAAWEEAFPKYVPLMREESDDFDYTTPAFGVGSGFDVRGKFSRAAMGSERKVANILANIAMQREKAIIKSNKNRVAQAVFGLAVQNPNPDFWLAVNPAAEQVPEIALDELRAMGIDEGAIEFLMQEPKQRAIDPKKNEVVNRINATLRKSDNVLAMRINGEDRYVFFNQNDPRAKRAAEALKNIDADQLGPVLGTISKVTRWMASVNTQYNPIFGAYNFLRDVQGAALQLSDTPLKGMQKQVLSGVLPSLKTIYSAMRAERDGKKLDTEMARLWNEFQEEGGQTGFRDMFSRSQERAEALEKEFKQITEGKAKAAGRAVIDWLSDYNDSMENATRLSAYKVAKEKFIKEGMSESEAKQQAASIAKNLTVNFNRKGQIATQAGALYAFFNAAVQGTTRLAQTLRGPAGKKIIAGGLLLGAMQAALLAAAGFDEEEPPEFVRERNIIIPLGGDKYFAFPMPLGYHVIPGFSRIITEWALSGFKDTPDRIASLTGMFLEAFNPIGNAGWSVQTLAPTFADPLVALSENKDWTGKPIARKDFSNMDPTPGYTRAKEGANILTEGIAKFLNFATGGTRADPGLISPTPEQIEYLIGQATGGIGREVTKAITSVEKTITGEELPPYKIPLYGRFVGETKSSAAESNRFYKNMERMNILDREIEVRRENREPIGEFIRENPEARLAPMARKTYRDIQNLRKRREQLVERDAPRESVKAVEEQIRRRMAMFNERVAQLKD